jgi:hypothetical protein
MQCSKRWSQTVNPSLQRGKQFSTEEERKLYLLVRRRAVGRPAVLLAARGLELPSPASQPAEGSPSVRVDVRRVWNSPCPNHRVSRSNTSRGCNLPDILAAPPPETLVRLVVQEYDAPSTRPKFAAATGALVRPAGPWHQAVSVVSGGGPGSVLRGATVRFPPPHPCPTVARQRWCLARVCSSSRGPPKPMGRSRRDELAVCVFVCVCV